ncbi:MAG: response regulator [bacterium]|nr:response regulator [bacterium]
MRRKVLVIDDNAGILFAMQQALELKGYDVHTSETFTGVKKVEKMAPDLIYLDISLVGQDGRQITQELKKNGKTKNIPIIIITAYPNASELTKEAGANDYLPKPFELEHLWKMTARYAS